MTLVCPTSTNQNLAQARLAPTITKKIKGWRTPRLRGTMGHRCHSRMADKAQA
jgi:hypothetical protein